MPEYLTVGKAFRLGTIAHRNYSGLAVASREAFFLVVGVNAFRAGLGLAGGLLADLAGKLTGWSKGRYLPESSGVVETDLAELPVDVTGHPDWPVRQEAGPVLVIPRPAVQSVAYSFWKWGVFVRTEAIEIRIEPPFFGRKKMLQGLRELGWEV